MKLNKIIRKVVDVCAVCPYFRETCHHNYCGHPKWHRKAENWRFEDSFNAWEEIHELCPAEDYHTTQRDLDRLDEIVSIALKGMVVSR